MIEAASEFVLKIPRLCFAHTSLTVFSLKLLSALASLLKD